jgi:serine/threonine protein kinase
LPLNEAIDVYSLGNVFYAVLTGVGPFYNETGVSQVHYKVAAGETPFVDPRWRNWSFAESKLIDMMEKLWTYSPDKRPDIFAVVAFLREAIKETRLSYMHEDG